MHKAIRSKQMFGKRFKKRRAWDCYSFLAVHIANELRAFKKYNVNSLPHEFYKEEGDNGTKEWHDVVDKMIYSFDQIARDYPNCEEMDVKSSEYKAYQAKIDEGLNLFAKYFRNLWD